MIVTLSPDEPKAPELIAIGVAGLLESLRDDVREDIAELRVELGRVESRVTARVEAIDLAQRETRGLIEAEAEDHRTAHGTFYEFIRAQELAAARRDGALGVLRFTVELLSRHAPRLVAIALAVAGALGVATGNVSVAIGQ